MIHYANQISQKKRFVHSWQKKGSHECTNKKREDKARSIKFHKRRDSCIRGKKKVATNARIKKEKTKQDQLNFTKEKIRAFVAKQKLATNIQLVLLSGNKKEC